MEKHPPQRCGTTGGGARPSISWLAMMVRALRALLPISGEGQKTASLTFIGRQLIICTFARGRRCARLIICYGRRYLEGTCVDFGNGGWLEQTMQQMRRAVIKKDPCIVRK